MKKDLDQIINIRPGHESDRAFIMATWLRGFYYGNFWFKEISKNAFMKHYHNIITEILSSKNTSVQVAALKDDDDIIVGYSVLGHKYSNPTIHWVHVKTPWRRLGIGRRLVPQDSDTATHMTAIGWKLKPQAMAFNPYKAFFEEE